MIYDCFTFFNELDVLEMRLEELSPVVDKFIIVEANRTFQGGEKPWYFSDQQIAGDRFAKWDSQIISAHIDLSGMFGSAWEREYFQRDSIKTFLEMQSVKDDDIIILSDADEIPRRSAVEFALNGMDNFNVRSFALDAYYYGLNVSGGHCHTNRIARWSYAKNMTMQELRTLDPPPNIVYDGGWHFSYLGTPEHIAEKFKAFAHTELNRPDTTDPAVLLQRMEKLGDLWGDGHVYERVEIDETWPELVKTDRERWRKYEW
jgi:beta-1,4-mannosyl-glycoprotein beta-1,4-N-acetylglucosaminyltransferase